MRLMNMVGRHPLTTAAPADRLREAAGGVVRFRPDCI
jgi:hypothetical protein